MASMDRNGDIDYSTKAAMPAHAGWPATKQPESFTLEPIIDRTVYDRNGHHNGTKAGGVPAKQPAAGLQGSYSPPPPMVDFTDVDRNRHHYGMRPVPVDLTDVDRNGQHFNAREGGRVKLLPGLLQGSATRVDFTDFGRGNRMYGAGGDDQRLFNLVHAMHSPGDDRQQLLNVSSLFDYAQFIFRRATLTTANSGSEADTAWETATANLEVTAELPVVIDQVLCEMGGGGDSHTSTLAVLGVLERHSWEAKMVVTLAALAVKYGEFLLLSQIYSLNPFAKAIGILKKHPAATATSTDLDAVRHLITLMLQLTSHVVRFSQHRSTFDDCFPHDDPSVTAVFHTFPVTAYWIIRSTVTAATHISVVATCSTTHDQFMLSSATERELTMWSEKLKKIFAILDENMTYVEKIIDEKREEKAYNQLLMTIFEREHQYNTTVISRLFFSSSDKEHSLFCGAKKFSLDVLKGETVLLLITLEDEKLEVLIELYDELKACNFNILWIPVVEGSMIRWDDEMIANHRILRKRTPWYSVEDPSMIRKEVIRFFKEKLNFNGLPILIPMDSRGRITTMNVMSMIKIWRNEAFPFTRTRGIDLWKAQSALTLDLLLPNDIDLTISNWVKEDKYIFAYGGEVDIEWIRKFTQATKSVAETTNMGLECIYFGKSCKTKTVRNITSLIKTDELGNYLEDNTMKVFWKRLESMVHSRIQLGMVDDESDAVMREIKKITSYDKSTASWVIICKGSKVISCVSGAAMQEVLVKYEDWKVQVDEMGDFEGALLAQITATRIPDHNCFRFEFPIATGKIPQAMRCPGCEKRMQIYATFLCCHDDGKLAM